MRRVLAAFLVLIGGQHAHRAATGRRRAHVPDHPAAAVVAAVLDPGLGRTQRARRRKAPNAPRNFGGNWFLPRLAAEQVDEA